MAANISHKLKNSLEGALAGGGDPATSPLYVFGPFLKLIVATGVAKITFGGSIWLAVLTIAVVSAMYRLVMKWVTDGSGGSGLSEEEFGSWAVKVNAAITFVEYTLTFLVSMSAMVTFIADRLTILNDSFLGIQYRTLVAVALSILTGWLVNRGPKVAARTFGPATAGVLILLWVMIFSSLFKYGFHLPEIHFEAFNLENIHVTIGGYVRILAVMTGIEVFANLVAAYDGENKQKSKMAFNSLLIIMGTTAVTMLILGPTIFAVSNPMNEEVSVFTQTMDILLPQPLPLVGTFIGILVLMSASAASAQGLQNLALGLKERRYIPPVMGEQNKFDVADKPVWLEVGIVSFCFLLFGTSEETYLAIYAAGVFVLLSMTGWAVTKRLIREIRSKFSLGSLLIIIGTIIAAIMTTGATISIFGERFTEGAWTYFIFIPILYVIFTYFRNRLGAPAPEMDYLGQLNAAQLAGFGFGQVSEPVLEEEGKQARQIVDVTWQPEPKEQSIWREKRVSVKHIAVLLDGSDYAAEALPITKLICETLGAQLSLVSAYKNGSDSAQSESEIKSQLEDYLMSVAEGMKSAGISVNAAVLPGKPAVVAKQMVDEQKVDLVVATTRGKSGVKNWLSEGLSSKLVRYLDVPVLLVQTSDDGKTKFPSLNRILIGLDGSIKSEEAIPYARYLSKEFDSELMLLSVPAVPESEKYRAPVSVLETIRAKAVKNIKVFSDAVARSLSMENIKVRSMVTGSSPAKTIVNISKKEKSDLIVITSRGRGGLDLLFMGSVAQMVVQQSNCPVLIVPVQNGKQ